MDNPYWSSDGQRHHIDLESIRLICFELLNLFEASKPLAEEFNFIELSEGSELSEEEAPLLRLHQKYAFVQASKSLLQLALLFRTYDDQMRESERAKEYVNHVKEHDDGNYIGILNGSEKFYLREACNKIIHAREVRPLYERIDRVAFDTPSRKRVGQDVWYLTGEIELEGKHFSDNWGAVLHLQPFLEITLAIIEFGDP